MTNILWNSDCPNLPTGYAMVSRNLLQRFVKAGIGVNYMSFQNQGMPINFEMFGEKYNFNLFYQLHHDEWYGNKDSVLFWANQMKPDLVAFLSDSFMLKWIAEKKPNWKEICKPNTKSLFYFPFDSDHVYAGAKEVMEQIDIRVAMAKWGQNVLKKDTGLDSYYIPHGFDPNVFRPIRHKEELKKSAGFENKFIVGMVARNQSRKMIPSLIQSFKQFQKDKPDAILFMHCDPLDPQGWNLIDYCNMEGLIINKDVFFGMQRYSLGIPEPRVNMIYNMFDIHVLPTTGEGFGLPIIESMAAGIPNIATDYTSCRELIEGHGELVPVKQYDYIIGQLNTRRALPDIPSMIELMNKLYYNKELRDRYSMDSIEFAKDFTWDNVVRMWLELFEKEL
jgi:glycosyltransferase involved in cell wall biosynthesis